MFKVKISRKSFDYDIEAKCNELTERLAEIGKQTAQEHFNDFASSEWYDSNYEPVETTTEKIESGHAVVAQGRQVAFIEFGAGVYYNGSESYKGTRPAGIVGIGEYGQGKGKRNAWGYNRQFGESSAAVITRGNPPANAMYYAGKEIKDHVEQVAKEVFG